MAWLTLGDGAGVIRWLLFAMFLLAGAWKIRHPALAGLALYDFGALRRPSKSGGVALGVGEVLLATGLALPGTVEPALITAAVALWLFTYAAARQLAMGRSFACFCFGDAEDLLSRHSVIRAVALAVLATIAAVGGPHAAHVPTSSIPSHFAAGAALLGISALLRHVPRAIAHHEHPALVLGGAR